MDDSNGGGSAPQSGDYRVDIVGHTDLVIYEGNGQGWDVASDEGDVLWANLIDGSPRNSTPHWIIEVVIAKQVRMIPNAPPTGMRVAYYDASNSEAGVQAWAPDSDVNVPDEWGLLSGFSMDPIPEGLTFGVMVLLSSVSLLVGYHYFRKRQETKVIAQ